LEVFLQSRRKLPFID
jgi:hypothetical protein